MAWVKVDDQFTDHPKIVAAGPLGGWLYVAGLCYCARYLTDGFIPRAQVRKLVDVDDVTPLVTALLTCNLWRESQGGYIVHDYLEYNPPAERVKQERAENAKRQAEWRENKRKNGRNAVSNDVTPSINNGVSHSVSNRCPVPVPVPLNTPSSLRSEGGAPARAKRHKLTEDWQPEPEHERQLIADYGRDVYERERRKFIRYFLHIKPKVANDTAWRATLDNWFEKVQPEPAAVTGIAIANGRASPRSTPETRTNELLDRLIPRGGTQ